MPNQLQIGLLGPVDIRVDEESVDVGGPQQRRLVAVLATARGAVATDRLVSILWPDDDLPADPNRTLSVYVSRLRGVLDEHIVRDGAGYRLADAEVDIDAFVAAAETGAASEDPERRRGDLERGLDMWRGDAFGEFAHEAWAQAAAVELVERRNAAEDELLDLLVEEGRDGDAVRRAGVAVERDPLRETPRRVLMLALHRSGRQPEALRAFQTYRAYLADELGLEPSATLIDLDQRIATGDRSLKAAPIGRRLKSYEVLEEIGRGAFAIVWRARQPGLGRDVALKQIRSEFANRPEFIRRFEVEAQLIAQLEHPYVVPLYDYWREPDSAYLAMRLLDGGSLEEQVAEQPLTLDDTLRLVEQVGSALAAAHRVGVVHRDVKPANVFVDSDRHYYLGDFGIALAVTDEPNPEGQLSLGSPAYAAPEQLRRESVDASADIYSFGILLYEALTGRLPFWEETTQSALLERQLRDRVPSVLETRPELPVALDGVIQRATAKDAADRYIRIEELIAEVRAIGDREAPTATPVGSLTVIAEERNPYKGLRAFGEADTSDFFGRDRLVDRLIEQLQEPGPNGRLVAAVGPSGSGKSSGVRAGLVPALRRGEMTGSDSWFFTSMLPGAQPFEELESALSRVASAPLTGLVEVMASDDRGIARAVKSVLPEEESELFLVIDQFEELFTLVEDENLRRRFLDGLVAAVDDPRSRLRVAVTIRADFWDRPLRVPELAAILEHSAVTVPPLAADELERAIVDPARRVGAEFEPGLVSEIVANVADQPGALPLLQYALTELYERRVSNVLTIQAYHELGGVSGALSRRAEELFGQATDQRREQIQRMFERLVSPGEGTEDTRRRALLGELAGVDRETVDVYGSARLLSFDRDPATREPTIEVAHEALLREWPRLRRWLEDNRDGLRVLRHLGGAAASWEAAGCDPDELYRGGRLESALELAATRPAALNDDETRFLTASREAHEPEMAKARRRFRRVVMTAVATAVVAAIALVAGIAAFVQSSRADDEAAEARRQAVIADGEAARAEEQSQLATDRAVEADQQREIAAEQAEVAASERDRADIAARDAETRRLLAAAELRAETDRTASMLLAIEAARRDGVDRLDALGALQRSLSSTPGFLGHLIPDSGSVFAAVFSADGESIFVFSGSELEEWDLESRTFVGSVPFDTTAFSTIFATLPDGTVMAQTDDRVVRTLDPRTGEEVRPAIEAPARAHIFVSPTGDTVALALNQADEVWLWDVDSWSLRAVLPHEGRPRYAGFSGDGAVVATGAENATSFVWSAESGEQLAGPFAPATASFAQSTESVLLNEDGTLLTTTTRSPVEVVTWRVASGEILSQTEPADGLHGTAVRLPDGRLAIGGFGVTILDPVTGHSDLYSGQTGPAFVLRLSADGSLIASVGDQGVSFWSTGAEELLATATPTPPGIVSLLSGLTVSADGRWAAYTTPGGGAVMDLSDGSIVLDAPGGAVDISPDGATLVRRMPDFSSELLDWPSGELRAIRPPAVPAASAGAWDPDGQWVAYGDFAGGVVVIDLDDGSTIAHLTELGGLATESTEIAQAVFRVSVSGDGLQLLAATFGGAAAQWNTSGWELLGDELISEGGFAFTWPTVHPTRPLVAFGADLTGTIQVADSRTLERSGAPLIGHRSSTGAKTFSESGTLLVSTSGELPAILWDFEQRRPIGVPYRNEAATAAHIIGDHTLITSSTKYLYRWNIDFDTWEDIACRAAGRNLTEAEWADFGPVDQPYAPTCEMWVR